MWLTTVHRLQQPVDRTYRERRRLREDDSIGKNVVSEADKVLQEVHDGCVAKNADTAALVEARAALQRQQCCAHKAGPTAP